jgi:hypothetical protein
VPVPELDSLFTRLDALRRRAAQGEGFDRKELEAITTELLPYHSLLRPGDKSEILPLVDRAGRLTGLEAPRWICHIVGLRHICAEVLLLWPSPGLGDAMILQIRSWSKDDAPGQLDMSVGGHLQASWSGTMAAAAFREMHEETGLAPEDLEGPLQRAGGYCVDEAHPQENQWNAEWREVFIGRIRAGRLGRIHFTDGEVAGLMIIELARAEELLRQRVIPLASALRGSLPLCLSFLKAIPDGTETALQ